MKPTFWVQCGTILLLLLSVHSVDSNNGDSEELSDEVNEFVLNVGEVRNGENVRAAVLQQEPVKDEKCNDVCGTETDVLCDHEDLTTDPICTCKDKAKTFQKETRKCKEQCTGEESCQNDGTCGETDPKFCDCKVGTSGDFCDIVDQCRDDKKFCGVKEDVKCGFDITSSKAACECVDKAKKFDGETVKECRVPCTDETTCANGATCSVSPDRFCKCKPRTSGDLCDIVDDCDEEKKFCGDGDDVKCKYDEPTSKAVCKCEDQSLQFDNSTKFCRKTCESDPCDEGEICTDKKICTCKTGYGGKNCDIILGCHKKVTDQQTLEDVCKALDATCVFDNTLMEATCKCPESKDKYDSETKFCRVTCKEGDKCEGNHECAGGLCKCIKGYEGAHCDIVSGCKEDKLGKICKTAEADCIYDKNDEKYQATCNCTDENYEYDSVSQECKDTLCEELKCVGGKCVELEVKVGEEKCTCSENICGNECTENCGEELDVVCTFKKADNSSTCSCEDPEKKFDENENICIGSCEPNPCKNGGTCDIVDQNVKCDCIGMFIGNRCETDACAENPCKNGGTCDVEDGAVKCKCEEPFSGNLCENDPCTEKPCKNGGACAVVDDSFNCTCPKPYTGDTCETGPCTENPCQKGGTCKVEGEKAKCSCKEPFGGEFCERDKMCDKVCGTDPHVLCVHEDLKKEPTCECDDPDKTFQKETRQCKEQCTDDDSCGNGAKCSETDPKFCICRKGTFGDFCDFVEKCRDDDTFCGVKKDVKCFYNITSSKEGCKCDDEDKKFDGRATVKECRVPCTKDTKCLNGATCAGSPIRFCRCKSRTSGDLCDTVDDCDEEKKFCGDGDDVECKYDEPSSKAVCKCEDQSHQFDNSTKFCRKTCETEACDEGEICTDKKMCTCKKGYGGRSCDVILGCHEKVSDQQTLEDVCEALDATCVLDNISMEATCQCPESKDKYDPETKFCRATCKEGDKCEGNHECAGGLCKCIKGYEGAHCDIVSGCKEDKLGKICTTAEADCIYDKNDEKYQATCNCTDENYEYDSVSQECKAKWCKKNVCGAGSKCFFDKDRKVGICTCTDETKYYDYFQKRCADPDKCVLQKTVCGQHKECVKGVCECKANFKKVNDTCIPNQCKNSPCFTGAKCEDADGIQSCTCEDGKYFDGSNCAESKCFLGNDFKKNCGACPVKMTWNKEKKECEPKKGDTACDDDCGYGYCLKLKGKQNNTCECLASVSSLEDGKCVLKETPVCANNKLTKDKSKCNCVGQFKQAKDGITCELISCLDQSAQDECKAMGAMCIMKWKNEGKIMPGHYCVCPPGYEMDNDKKKCTDICSIDKHKRACLLKDQFCYNSADELKGFTPDCRCPPPLRYISGDKTITEGCKDLAQNVYMIHKIPVLKKRYEIDGKINDVLLNADLILSMKQSFTFFDYGYLQDYTMDGDLLMCTTWVQFNADPLGEVERIINQTRSFNCTGCDESLSLWPPNLLLSQQHLEGVTSETLDFCSENVKNILCGKHAVCDKNKCSCPLGFRTVEYTIRDIIDKYRIERCEDIDECLAGTHDCSKNTTCVNLPGDYHCECKSGFKKEKDPVHSRVIHDKEDCFDLCTPNPCNSGSCAMKESSFDCNCPLGKEGTFCDRPDVSLGSAKKSTAIVGAVLGTILGITLIAFFIFWRRIKKNSYSEDFAPAPRAVDSAAEMMERRPIRGMINKSYE